MKNRHGRQPQVQGLEFLLARADNCGPKTLEICRELVSDFLVKGCDVLVFIQADAVGGI